MSRGRFITFEGGEGTGKTTQASRLAAALERSGLEVVRTYEPGGVIGAQDIRRLLVEGDPARWDGLTEVLLNYAARWEHLRAVILPALKAGKWVVCDRFSDSTMAYQGYGHGVGRDLIRQIHAIVVGETIPDLTLVFDLPAPIGLERAAARNDDQDRYERMGVAFHERLKTGFLEIARAEPSRCAVIDALGDIKAVEGRVFTVVSERLGVLPA